MEKKQKNIFEEYIKKQIKKKVLTYIIGLLSGGTLLTLLLILLLVVMSVGVMLVGVSGNESSSSGENISSGVSIPEGCLKHSADIKSELKVQGLDEKHLDVMLAICAQESGGSVADIFQSSESLGKPPNSIGPKESIKAGVKHYKSVIEQAQAKDIGSDKWKIALQAYNMGGGFVDYAIKQGGKFTESIVQAFSSKMAATNGWSSYGDVKYVEHVMRYLSAGGSASLDPKSIGSPVDVKLLGRVTCKIGGYSGHPGIDLALAEGTPVFSMTDGTVVQAVGSYTAGGSNSAYFGKDNHITIKSKDNPNIFITYRHMKPGGVLVKAGQAVKAGQRIALTGNTGFSSGPHLHIEWLKNNQYAISAAIDWYSPLATKYKVQNAGLSCGV